MTRSAQPTQETPAYRLYGPDLPISPLVVSVPHAGRDYDDVLLGLARCGRDALERLEDRHADLLADGLIARGMSVLVARAPRAFIDLNRDEREIDPGMILDPPHNPALVASAKVRGGLGLVPRRLVQVGELWRRPLRWDAVQARIAAVHRPYHQLLGAMLASARERFGYAVLLDLHSMPPLPGDELDRPRIVIGDRFGRSATGRLTSQAVSFCTRSGFRVAQNHPYAGSYLLERHGNPANQIHAIQCEVDRSLYLDEALMEPGQGLDSMRTLVTGLGMALAREWDGDLLQAAE